MATAPERIKALETRLDNVEKTVDNIPLTYATKNELEHAMLNVNPVSRDEIKAAMGEVLADYKGKDTQAKRAWILDLLKVAIGALGAGGVVAVIQAFQSMAK